MQQISDTAAYEAWKVKLVSDEKIHSNISTPDSVDLCSSQLFS